MIHLDNFTLCGSFQWIIASSKDMANARDNEDKCVGLTDMLLKPPKLNARWENLYSLQDRNTKQPVRIESLSDGMLGVPLESPKHVVYLFLANSAGIDVVQNEAVNHEAGNCGLSLSLFQQQMMFSNNIQ